MRDDIYTTMAQIEDRFWWFVAKRRILRSLIHRFGDQGTSAPSDRPKLLDIGCGTGGLLRDMSDGYEVHGLDSADAAREACAKRGFETKPCWLPDDLPAEEGGFDACVMSDVLEHVEDDAGSVKAAARKLKPGGIMVCTVPAHMWLWTKRDEHHHHFRRYSRKEYEGIFEDAGLEPVVVSWYMTHLMPLMLLQRVAAMLTRDKGAGDLQIPMAPLNGALRMAFASERSWIGRFPMPFGASLISVHRRVGAGSDG